MFGRTRTQAEEKGKALLQRMNGSGWKLALWENLGWHYSVSKGCMKVYPAHGEDNRFHCLFGEGGGNPVWTNKHGYYADPNEAVAAQLQEAQELVDHYQEMIDKVRSE